MRPRYAVVDKEKRDSFEKEWQLPYGYGNCYVFLDPLDAIECRKNYLSDAYKYIIEKHYDGIKEEMVF